MTNTKKASPEERAANVATQGRTLRMLNEHTEPQGGEVVAVSALTSAAPGATMFALRRVTLDMLRKTFVYDELTNTIREYGISDRIENLTDGEAAAIAGFGSINTLRNRLAQAGSGEISRKYEKDAEDVYRIRRCLTARRRH